VTVTGLTSAVLTASVRTRIEQTTATTASATALHVELTLTGTVLGVAVSIPLGSIVAGEATCTTPAAVVPTETGLTPASGPVGGGTTVSVTGTGFVAGATSVSIGGATVPASAVTVSSPTTLSFVTPAHAPGPVDVTVTTPAGLSPAETFTFVAGVIAGTDTSGGNVPGTATTTPGGGDVLASSGAQLRDEMLLGTGALLAGLLLLLAASLGARPTIRSPL
jgi:hypothetical protein